MLTRTQTAQRIGAAITLADNLRESVDHLLTWGELTDSERGFFTRAANAADLAVYRLRLLEDGHKVSTEWL